MNKQIKRECPKCKGPLVLLLSTDQKVCTDCKTVFKWNLEVGQQPIYDGKRNDD